MNIFQINNNFSKIEKAFGLGKLKFTEHENRLQEVEVRLEANISDIITLEKKREEDINSLHESISSLHVKILKLEENNIRNVKYIEKLQKQLNLLVRQGSERLRKKDKKSKLGSGNGRRFSERLRKKHKRSK